MPPHDVPPHVREALWPFVEWIVTLAIEAATAHAKRDDVPEFVDVKTAAKLFCLAPTTVERWAKEGRLTAHRAGKKLVIKTSDVRAIVEAQGPARGGKARPTREDPPDPPADLNALSPAEILALPVTRSTRGKRS